MKKNVKNTIAMAMILGALCAVTGCANTEHKSTLAEGGTLLLKVNPEIAVEYDDRGIVTEILARNADAKPIVAECDELIGETAQVAIPAILSEIGEAGYFVEELEGVTRQIVIEIEPGSALPNDLFIDEVIGEVRDYVAAADWYAPIILEGEHDFGFPNDGLTDYGVTDYDDGKTDYGVTDYDDGKTDYGVTDYVTTAPTVQTPAPKPETKPAPKPVETTAVTTAGMTDYDDTDYGVTDYDDGKTDYGVTDYDDGKTDYGVTDYVTTAPAVQTPAPKPETKPAQKPVETTAVTTAGMTDYDDTDYGVTDYDDGKTDYGVTDYDDGKTDYGVTDYDDGKTDYGVTDYVTTAPTVQTPASKPETKPAQKPVETTAVTTAGMTDYDDTDYGVTDYDDGKTDYGVTDYDDGKTDYGVTDYDDGKTDYGTTDYDDTDYDD